MRQIAGELTNLLGRPVVYINRSLDDERAALLAGGLTPFVADLLVGLDQMFRESVLGETTSTVEELTGEPPGTLSQCLAENIESFESRLDGGALARSSASAPRLVSRGKAHPLVRNPKSQAPAWRARDRPYAKCERRNAASRRSTFVLREITRL
jgi:hypothetical protein